MGGLQRTLGLWRSAVAASTATTVPHVSTKTVPFAHIQQGSGRLVAESAAAAGTTGRRRTTALAKLAHQAPARWIPVTSSQVAQAGAAACYMSNYGGGLLPGDVLQWQVQVQKGARLTLLTQGANRVYKQSTSTVSALPPPATVHFEATVGPDALLVVAPDPLTPFQNSAYSQQQSFCLTSTSNLVALDWISAGRMAAGERWQHCLLTHQTVLKVDNQVLVWDAVNLSDAVCGMDWRRGVSDNNNHNNDNTGIHVNAYASILLHGPKVQAVVERAWELQQALLETQTRIRAPVGRQSVATAGSDSDSESVDNNDNDEDSTQASCQAVLSTLAGRVLWGVSQVTPYDALSSATSCTNNIDASLSQTHVVRVAATNNEDLYRVFFWLLQPLSAELGLSVYQDRIRAVQSAASPRTFALQQQPKSKQTRQEVEVKQTEPTDVTLSSTTFWSVLQLADSALPVGSFAHSAGLEAAVQNGLVATEQDVAAFLRAATQATLCQVLPILSQAAQDDAVDWQALDRSMHAVLAGNAPACRASLDQGRSLLRVARAWKPHDETLRHVHETLTASGGGHLAVVWRAVTRDVLGLNAHEAATVYGFTVARDVVSAAVRLHLIGPTASVRLLDQTQAAVQEILLTTDADAVPSTCAPVLDALQPTHDSLAMRLFRT